MFAFTLIIFPVSWFLIPGRYAIATGKSYSYILQFAISLGQLYGTAAYFITSYLEGDNFASSPFFYYSYYIGANFSWVVIPTLIAIRCWKKTCAAFQAQAQAQKKTKVRWADFYHFPRFFKFRNPDSANSSFLFYFIIIFWSDALTWVIQKHWLKLWQINCTKIVLLDWLATLTIFLTG